MPTEPGRQNRTLGALTVGGKSYTLREFGQSRDFRIDWNRKRLVNLTDRELTFEVTAAVEYDRATLLSYQGYLKSIGVFHGQMTGDFNQSTANGLETFLGRPLDLSDANAIRQVEERIDLRIAEEAVVHTRGGILFGYAYWWQHRDPRRLYFTVGRRQFELFSESSDGYTAADLRAVATAVRQESSGRGEFIHFDNPEFASVLETEYRRLFPEDLISFYVGHEFRIALANIRGQPRILGPADVALYVPIGPATDQGVVSEIKGRFERRGIAVYSGLQRAAAASVLVVSVDRDPQGAWERYLLDLARSGALRGKYLVLNICYFPGDHQLATRLIHDFGVRGVSYYSDQLPVPETREVLVTAVDELMSLPSGGLLLEDWLGSAAKRLLSRNPALQSEFVKFIVPVRQRSD